ncbi:MAG: hypothetical protein V4568_08370 [Pseudomonadota bacterium]
MERNSLHQFTDKLGDVIRKSGRGILNRDEFGKGKGGFFMHGPNADRFFSAVEFLLRNWVPLSGGYAIKRYGSPAYHSEQIHF